MHTVAFPLQQGGFVLLVAMGILALLVLLMVPQEGRFSSNTVMVSLSDTERD